MKIKKFLFVITTMFLMVQGASAWNGSGSSGDPYLIASTADWNTLASNVANGNTYSNTYFKLTADITVTTMVTATFSGTFDGGGHTLTFNYTATGDNAAPFAYITGATIKNLRVAGTINTGYKFAAGIVAISNGGTITNCQSSVTINSSTSGDGTHGGLVADSYQGRLDINNCLFDGKLLGTTTTSCGGIVGWHKSGSTLNISNSLFAPTQVTLKGGAIIARGGANSLSNCYYISDWAAATVQGTNANSMTAEALVAALNNGDKNWCVHRGNAIPVMVNLVINNKTEWDNFSSHAGNYENKYVQLNADISNITAMTSGTFQGIFDGNGHTLTVNLTNSGGNVAPFYYLYGGTIMNLTVSGGVTTAGSFNAGLVARTHGGINYIQNCIIHTNVAVGDYGGGVVGHADNASSLTISDCIYDGTITHTGSYAGGFIGWYNNNQTLDLVMTNCLFKGDYTGNGQFHPIGVKKWAGIFKSINCTNCYYTKNPANIDSIIRTFTDGTKVSELTIGTTGVSIASGSYATFQGTKYYYGTVTLGYNGPMATTNFSLDGTHLDDNSFTISTDNAAFDDGTATIKWDFPGRGTVGDPYQISSAAVWDFLADEVDTGNNNYEGKYFRQTDDFTITRMVGAADNADDSNYNDEVFRTFNGTYDGYGHILNLNLDVTGERYVGPFHCVSGATIKNLKVTGSVQVHENTNGAASIHHASALIGCARGTGQVTIENCLVSASVSSAEYMGGLIGHSWNANVTIEGCAYTGTLTAIGTNYTGGLIGWGGTNGNCTFNLTNNLFAGSYSGSGKFHPVGFLYNPTGNTRTVTNTYYMTGLRNVGDDDGNSLVKGLANKGKFAYSITAGSGVTVANAGTETEYNVSGITAYSHGIKYNDVYYAGNEDAVSLSLSGTAPTGYSVYDYTASAGTLTGSSNPYYLTMPAANVTINVLRYLASKHIDGYNTVADGWYLISSPMVGTVNPTSVTNMLSNTYDLYYFDQNREKEWVNYKESDGNYNPSFDLVSGKGYLYANSADVDLTFVGTPYSGDGIVSLSYSEDNSDPKMWGWNLIGNPFGTTATIDKPFYRMNEYHTEIIAATDSNIAPMEGIFVYRDEEGPETTTFTPSGSKGGERSLNNIVINLERSNGTVIDRAIVSFDEDRTLPKFQIGDNSTKLYIPRDGEEYAIAYSDKTGEMPLNFRAAENGEYTLSVTISDPVNVHLIDNLTGADIHLLSTLSYSFTAKTTDYASRFRLIFSANENDGLTDSPQENEDFAFIGGDGQLIIHGTGTIQIIDLLGRVISTKSTEERINTNGMTPGVYVLQVITESAIKTQRIVVK